MRRVAVGALCVVGLFAATGCAEELHRYGARLRGANVVPHPDGQPGHFYTGGATASLDTCIWVIKEDPYVDDSLAWPLCQVFYGWWEGSLGYRGT